MRKLIAFLVLLALALAAPAPALAVGMPLMKGLENPEQLATLIEASLTVDETGAGLLDVEHCVKRALSRCATALNYFEGIRKEHPSASLQSVAELPAYLRSLVSKPGPPGRWRMSRLLVTVTVNGETKAEDVQTVYDTTGWARAFRQGEVGWYDVNTGEVILAGDCGNVVGALIKPPPVTQRLRPRVVYREPSRALPPMQDLPARVALPPAATYAPSHPDFGTFPRAVCPPGGPPLAYPRCR